MCAGNFPLISGLKSLAGPIPLFRLFCVAVLTGLILSACGSGKTEQQQRRISEERLVAEGVEILRSGTPVQRDSVTRSFYSIRNADLLVARLNDTDVNVQIGVVSALGYLKDDTAVKPLNDLLLAVNEYLLRETIITVLGELRDTSSVTLLVGLLDNKDVDRDLRLSLPITLAAFAETPAAGLIEDIFAKILEQSSDDLELCSFVAMGVQEIVNADNCMRFRKFLPELRKMAEKRKEEAGEDLLWSNFYNAIEKLETFETPAS
jgi:HEAT repeat protein